MYTYYELREDVCRLCKLGVETGSIGRSVGGKHILYFHLGPKEGGQLIVQGGIHAREWITSLLVTAQVDFLMKEKFPLGVYFLPMTNPDGVTLAQRGAREEAERKRLVKINGGEDFSLWKANLRGVDLNCNFDARWGKGKGNRRKPAPSSYIGESPTSEPETKALVAFTKRVNPLMTVSYHALGREVYYEFFQKGEALERDRALGGSVAEFLGYNLVHGDLGSAGGYKDWCVSALGIPSLTIEIVGEEHAHPLDESDLKGEENNLWIPLLLTKTLANL